MDVREKSFGALLGWPVAIAVVIAAAFAGFHFWQSYQRLTAQAPTATVTIPPGSTIYDIDRILAGADVLPRGGFIAAVTADEANDGAATSSLEGHLFPDTYNFYINANATSVIQKFLGNFNVKVGAAASEPVSEDDLIIASMVQKEVASSTDMAIVAGIFEKRLAAGDYLNIDATICYAKQVAAPTSTAPCDPITASDLKIDSPYNTYLHKGLPPTPIGNPGLAAINATLDPQASPYWYYLSDPATGATIYAKTLQQQEANQKKYLSY